jgi:sugar lactone lactonase YvrE
MKLFFFFPLIVLFSCAGCQKKNITAPGTNPGPGTSPLKATVVTLAGEAGQTGNTDGQGSSARFTNPGKICFDPRNNVLYVADHIAIRAVDEAGNVTTYMGEDQLNRFDDIRDIDVAPGAAGSLYFTTKYNALYKIEAESNAYKLTQLTEGEGNNDGDLTAGDHLDGTYGVAPGLNGDIALYNTYWTCLKRAHITSLTPLAGTVEAWAGKPTDEVLGAGWPFQDGHGTDATFSTHIYDICSDGIGNIWVPDKDNARIRKVTPSGDVTSFLPYADTDGDLLIAHIKADGVGSVAANQDGSRIYFTAEIGSTGNSSPLLRLLEPGKGVVSIAGFHDGHQDGDGKEAAFGYINGLAATPDGKTIFVSEEYNKVIRKITIQ